jgi:hypothetical protein
VRDQRGAEGSEIAKAKSSKASIVYRLRSLLKMLVLYGKPEQKFQVLSWGAVAGAEVLALGVF